MAWILGLQEAVTPRDRALLPVCFTDGFPVPSSLPPKGLLSDYKNVKHALHFHTGKLQEGTIHGSQPSATI